MFLNAADEKEIISHVVRRKGSISLRQAGANLQEGDEIILSVLEHHSNIVPWQIVAEQTGAVIKAEFIDDAGIFLMDEYEKLLSEKTKMVAVTHVSNALGTIVPVEDVIRLAREKEAFILLDDAGRRRTSLSMCRPSTSISTSFPGTNFTAKLTGVLYGKEALLDAMPPTRVAAIPDRVILKHDLCRIAVQV